MFGAGVPQSSCNILLFYRLLEFAIVICQKKALTLALHYQVYLFSDVDFIIALYQSIMSRVCDVCGVMRRRQFSCPDIFAFYELENKRSRSQM